MKKAAIFGCLGFALFWVVFVRGIPIETFRDSKVSAGEFRRPWDIFFAHADRTKYIKVAGKTFREVRGLKPFYLNIPNSKMIIFVTLVDNANPSIHCFNLATKEDIKVDGHGSGFGASIGANGKPGDRYADYIQEVKSKRLTLVVNSGDWGETLVLNLATKSIESRETLYFNRNGDVTNRTLKLF